MTRRRKIKWWLGGVLAFWPLWSFKLFRLSPLCCVMGKFVTRDIFAWSLPHCWLRIVALQSRLRGVVGGWWDHANCLRVARKKVRDVVPYGNAFLKTKDYYEHTVRSACLTHTSPSVEANIPHTVSGTIANVLHSRKLWAFYDLKLASGGGRF